jgi:indolepyruvate decarboxylase
MLIKQPGHYTVSTYLVARLAELGIKHLFNVAGSYCGGLLRALPATGLIEAVFTTNEQESGYAADAYSRLNNYGAVCGTYGVGVYGLVNAVAGAYVERCAVVVINGGPTDEQIAEEVNHGVLFLHSTGRLRTDREMFQNITAAAEIIRTAAEAPGKIDAVLQVCMAEHRPVYLEINKGLWDQACASPASKLCPTIAATNPAALNEAVQDAVIRIKRAKHPMIWGGEEVSRWHLQKDFQELVDSSRLPFATTLPGKGLLSETHPGFIGVYDGRFAPPETRQIVGRADCILALGTSLCDFVGDIVAKDFEFMILASGNGVRIGYHLYDNIGLKSFITALTKALVADKFTPAISAAELSASRSAERARDTGRRSSDELTFDSAFAQMESYLQDKIVIADTSLSLFAAADLPLRQASSFISQSTWMSIGYSVGAAVGASCATGKRVVAFVGDCGFRQGAQGLATLAQYKLPAIVCVISNRMLGIQQFLTGPDFYTPVEAPPDYFNTLTQWDYCSLAKSFGLEGRRVTTLADLEAALQFADKHTTAPLLVELVLSEKDLPRAVRDVLLHPVARIVQDDMDYPLLSGKAVAPS